MTKKRKKMTPWQKMKKTLDKALGRVEVLELSLRQSEAELNEVKWERDRLAKHNRGLIDQNLKLLQDYHLLAAGVFDEQRSHVMSPIRDGVKE